AGAEGGFGADAARGVADVLRDAFDEGGAPAIAALFFNAFDAAERDAPAARVLLGFALDVAAPPGVELALDVAAPEEGAGAIAQIAPEFVQHRVSRGRIPRWFPCVLLQGERIQ